MMVKQSPHPNAPLIEKTRTETTPQKKEQQKNSGTKNMDFLSPLPVPDDEKPVTKWSSSFVQKTPPKNSFIPATLISDSNKCSLHRSPNRSPDPIKKYNEARDKHKSAIMRNPNH